MPSYDNPHIAFPFQLGAAGTGLLYNEQDSDEDVVDCVEVLLRTARGIRLEVPEYGVIPQEFRQGGADIEVYAAAIARWEPRARALLARKQELLDLVDRIRIAVEGRANA